MSFRVFKEMDRSPFKTSIDQKTYCVLSDRIDGQFTKYLAIQRFSDSPKAKIFIGGFSMAALKSQIRESNEYKSWFTLNLN